SACSKSKLCWRTSALMRRMSATLSSRWPSTEALTGLHALWDIGQFQLATETSGDASHSPQPTCPFASTRTSNASWLPSPMSRTSGSERWKKSTESIFIASWRRCKAEMPLPPALSPSEGERENLSPLRRNAATGDGGMIVEHSRTAQWLFPLPRRGGEGQG